MKFTDIVEGFQNLQENQGKVVLVRCRSVFMVALGKDAIFLNKALKLKVTCMKKIIIPFTTF